VAPSPVSFAPLCMEEKTKASSPFEGNIRRDFLEVIVFEIALRDEISKE